VRASPKRHVTELSPDAATPKRHCGCCLRVAPLAPPGRRGRSLTFSTISCPTACEVGQPRFHGSGASSFRSRRLSCTIARAGGFAPTRSARTPPVARTLGRRRENAYVRHCQRRVPRPSRATPPKRHHRTTRLREADPSGSAVSRSPFAAGPLARSCSRMRGPPHGFFREEGADPLHPRCLPSRGCPIRGGREAARYRGRTGIHRLSPTCGLLVWRLFVPRSARYP